SISGGDGHKAVAALAELYLQLGRYSEAMATAREGWVNLYSEDAALCPGAEGFSREERKRAEDMTHKFDAEFRGIAHRRNDLLHAQYQPKQDVQDGQGIMRSVHDIVSKLRKA